MRPLRVLIVEDHQDDAILLHEKLRQEGFDVVSHRVQKAAEMKEALRLQTWDLILSDYAMPRFNGLAALKILKESGFDIPFIIVSGSIGEEIAVRAMKAGASDYIMKDNLARLGAAVSRELQEARQRDGKRLAEAALQESEARFRSTADSAPVMIWISDAAGRYTWLNKPWVAFSGRPQTDSLGHGWSEGIHPDDRQYALEAYLEHFKSRSAFVVEYRRCRHDGAWRWIRDNGTPLFGADLEFTGYVGSCIDLTDRKETEDALKRCNTDLEQFAYSATHDLREPLRAIAIYSELLARRYAGTLDSQGLEYLSHMTTGAKRMETLIRDLLVYTKTVSLTEGPIVVCDAEACLKEALSTLQENIRESGAAISWDSLPRLRIRPLHLQQIFQNLIGNAVKYRGDEPPRIHVGAASENDCWRISVSDNGIGIDPQYSQKIFGLFKRLHTADKYSGTGIGLALCLRLVERYRGRIWVDSTLGNGAVFHFVLPGEGETNLFS